MATEAMQVDGGDDFVNLTEDGSLRLKKTKTVEEGRVPSDGDELTVHYRGCLKGSNEAFDASRDRGQPFKFVLGRGNVILGWDVGFRSLKVGEKGVLECGPEYGYGEEGHPPKIPGGATLVFEVELLGSAVRKKELFELTFEEKQAEAAKHKAAGLELFKKEDWSGATAEFEEACHFCDVKSYSRDDTPLPDEVAALFAACQSNAAMCCIKAKDWPAAAAHASRALKATAADNDAGRAKVLYRRGLARSFMGMLDEAKQDLTMAARLEPKNRAVRTELARVKSLAAAQSKAQKSLFSSAFDKVDLFPDKPRNVHNPSQTDNPYAFLHFKSSQPDPDTPGGGDSIDGVVVLRVFADACPKTARNFLALCKGDRGISKHSAKPLHYKNCLVHRVVPEFMIQTGDVVCNDGTSGESIYGRCFDDEHFKVPHDTKGTLSMANKGPNTNASQFFITVDEASHCDGNSVAFGRVVLGQSLVDAIAALPPAQGTQRPRLDVRIVDCGVLSKEDAEARIAAEEERVEKTEEESDDDDDDDDNNMGDVPETASPDS